MMMSRELRLNEMVRKTGLSRTEADLLERETGEWL